MSTPDAKGDPRSTLSHNHLVPDILVPDDELQLSPKKPNDPLVQQHPISRCPDDILRDIFESVGTNPKHRLPKEAIWLSSVCRRWRTIALNTPTLWNQILLDVSKPQEIQDFVRTQLVPRSKHVPTKVIVDGLQDLATTDMRPSGIQDINSISELKLLLVSHHDVSLLYSSRFTPPAGKLHSLRIVSGMDLEGDVFDYIKHDILSLLERFPPFSQLAIEYRSDLVFTIGSKNLFITHLDLSSMQEVDIGTVLEALPNLGFLTVRMTRLVLGGASDGVVLFPNIRSISLYNTVGNEWMGLLAFPQLEELHFNRNTGVHLNFISSHRSITSIRCSLSGDSIGELARVASQLTEIGVAPSIANLYYPPTAESELPFPHLKSLIILATDPPETLTVAEFDALVQASCLPLQHPKSLATRPSHRIDSFRIHWSQNLLAEWRDSDLYKESREIDFGDPGGFRISQLSWPDKS